MAGPRKTNNRNNIGLDQHTLLQVLIGHTGSVGVLAFDPSGVTVASGGSDTTIRIWMTATGHCTRTLSGHTDWVMGLSFSPTNLSVLASTGDDNIIWLWSLTTGCKDHGIITPPSPPPAAPAPWVGGWLLSGVLGLLASGRD